MNQAELRKLYAGKREAITHRSEKEEALREAVLSWLSLNPGIQRIFLYASYRQEADTLILLEELLKRGYCVFCPRVLGREMAFYRITALSDLRSGYRGIPEPEPRKDCPEEPDEDSLILCPGLVFDARGGRIGYGGGFYDRYLSGRRGVRAGYGFSFQVRETPLALEDHDILMDLLFTECGVIKAGDRGEKTS